MGDLDEADPERPQPNRAAGAHPFQVAPVGEVVLAQLAGHQAEREVAAVDRDAHLFEQIRYGADVILVAVGQNDAADFLRMGDEVGEIRDDDIDAENLFLGKHEAGVDHDQIAPAAQHRAIQTEFAEATERDDLQALAGGPGFSTPGTGDHQFIITPPPPISCAAASIPPKTG